MDRLGASAGFYSALAETPDCRVKCIVRRWLRTGCQLETRTASLDLELQASMDDVGVRLLRKYQSRRLDRKYRPPACQAHAHTSSNYCHTQTTCTQSVIIIIIIIIIVVVAVVVIVIIINAMNIIKRKNKKIAK